MTDLIQRFVQDLGFLPMIIIDGVEVYRGEYQKTPQEALDKCQEMNKQISQ